METHLNFTNCPNNILYNRRIQFSITCCSDYKDIFSPSTFISYSTFLRFSWSQKMLKYYRTIVLFYGFLFNLPITSPRLEIQVMHFWTKYCISDVVYSLLLSGSVWDQFASLMMIWTLIIWCQFLKIDLFKRGSGKERREREREYLPFMSVLLKYLQQTVLGQFKPRNHEAHQGLPGGGYWAITCCLSWLISKKLKQKREPGPLRAIRYKIQAFV